MNSGEALLHLDTGRIDGPPTGVRTVGDLSELFGASPQGIDLNQVVYETYGCPSIDAEPAQLLYATTVLHPGSVGGEFFMTRGHFHTKVDRGELCLTLSGNGLLLLRNREGEVRYEVMTPGSIHNIDGHWAHRTVNVGKEPLTFFVSWMSDCGHDYQSILEEGFGARVYDREGQVELRRDPS